MYQKFWKNFLKIFEIFFEKNFSAFSENKIFENSEIPSKIDKKKFWLEASGKVRKNFTGTKISEKFLKNFWTRNLRKK